MNSSNSLSIQSTDDVNPEVGVYVPYTLSENTKTLSAFRQPSRVSAQRTLDRAFIQERSFWLSRIVFGRTPSERG